MMLVSDSDSPSDSSATKVTVANPVAGTVSQGFVETGAAALINAPTLAFELDGLVLSLLGAELLGLLMDVPCVHCEEGCNELPHLEQTWGHLHGDSLHGALLFQFLQLRVLLLLLPL
jgi:hypothetical protein